MRETCLGGKGLESGKGEITVEGKLTAASPRLDNSSLSRHETKRRWE